MRVYRALACYEKRAVGRQTKEATKEESNLISQLSSQQSLNLQINYIKSTNDKYENYKVVSDIGHNFHITKESKIRRRDIFEVKEERNSLQYGARCDR